MNRKGKVYLVGSGPGDPELLTIKALRLLQEAEVVFYDRLVSREILELIPPGVSCFSVGKSAGRHCVPQEEINEQLLRAARKDRIVVRLKGGDPYLFGRGGEEALVLARHGIAFEIIPGITAASGCSAYTGMPLTHRGVSRSVRFLTGHFRGDEKLVYDWNKIADPDCTLVFYMGLSNLEQICTSLMSAGLSESTPAAAIANGTTIQQRQLVSTLANLPSEVLASDMVAPVMVIIGAVVDLNEELNWFSSSLMKQDDVSLISARG